MKFNMHWIKFKTAIGVFLAKFIYNFNKFVPGVKVRRNVRYIQNGNRYNKLDIFYAKSDSVVNKPVIIYFHGGGWAAYSKSCYSTVCKRLASMGYVVFNCNYSLTPRYTMSRIVSDAVSAILFTYKNAEKFGGDPKRVCLAGDSAGAHISSLISGLSTSKEGVNWFGEDNQKLFASIIKANILFYGAYDLNSIIFTDFPNIKTYINGIIDIDGPTAPSYLKKYSPVTYVTNNFPATFMSSGAIDPLHESQSMVFSDMLKKRNVKLNKLFFEPEEFRAMHAYMIVDGLKTTEMTFEGVEAFLNEVFDK